MRREISDGEDLADLARTLPRRCVCSEILMACRSSAAEARLESVGGLLKHFAYHYALVMCAARQR